MNARAELQTRLDQKYIVSWDVLEELVEALGSHRVLEIEGSRVFGYDSVYFDTESFLSYRQHVQGRRKRFKCRTRHYMDNELCYFEVKLKGGRGETDKRRLEYELGTMVL